MEEVARLQRRVESLEAECGCQTGALAGFSALAAFALSVVAFGPWAGGWAGTALAGFVAFALAVGAGKQLALSRAARRRDQLLRTLEELGGREEAQLVQVH